MDHIRVCESHNFKPFDCGDSDLNDFLLNDSINHLSELMAVTYIMENGDDTLAYWSLLNDKIVSEKFPGRSAKERVLKLLGHKKRGYDDFPAMKIGRLGVNVKNKGNRLGSEILDYIKILFVTNNRTGCRFITVDAYRTSMKFYINNGFKELDPNDKSGDTTLMYYDLSQIKGLS